MSPTLRRLLVPSLALAVLAGPAAAAPPSAREVVDRLDMTSFRNSIGPRRSPTLKTLADYGFTQREETSFSVTVLQADGGWMYDVGVLSTEGDRTVICVTDRALNGGSYYSVVPVEVTPGPDGLLRATGRALTDPRCERPGPPR
ncbi:MAG: hypothetical protein JWP92_3158 [Caulobacter sp.]|nr:hypothetical protein [Caulobacter sp.]